jgi:hypothetical protein
MTTATILFPLCINVAQRGLQASDSFMIFVFLWDMGQLLFSCELGERLSNEVLHYFFIKHMCVKK